jgi:hypothetical protein
MCTCFYEAVQHDSKINIPDDDFSIIVGTKENILIERMWLEDKDIVFKDRSIVCLIKLMRSCLEFCVIDLDVGVDLPAILISFPDFLTEGSDSISSSGGPSNSTAFDIDSFSKFAIEDIYSLGSLVFIEVVADPWPDLCGTVK